MLPGLTRLSSVASLLLLSLSPLPAAGQASSCGNPQSNNSTASVAGKAVYFITNDQVNSVVALPIGADGTLSPGTVTATGGAGSVALNSKNEPATPDALVSQSALTLAGQFIFAVNAGSNTLSMLSISPSDPTRISLVGQPVAVPGEFPNTVAASAKHRLVCVGMTGARAGISCASFSPRSGLEKMDALRVFDLGQTTPPVGPTNTVSHAFFSADESTLFTTVKGDPPTNKTGFLSVLRVVTTKGKKRRGGAVAAKMDTRSTPEGTAVLFGSQAIPGTKNGIFATDASFGAAVLSVDHRSSMVTTLAKGVLQGQKATCWATISAATGTAFVTDVGVNRLVEMSLNDASVLSELDLSANGDPGLIDLRAGGNFVYALSPGNGTTEAAVTVLDVSARRGGQGPAKMVQHFKLGGIAEKNSMGMAVLA
ncbi:hypothetical protein B0H63DRAFT_504916 [Podospora didyma]|uniref:3-carboxymuconate cyclase n=1 Tax=Podospora didyma TaxID=330526 RepID=A0AAE0P3Z6_9PEZI|nr:hypothetical protein B0H63DRAFT_504916 [Podospora didyma]